MSLQGTSGGIDDRGFVVTPPQTTKTTVQFIQVLTLCFIEVYMVHGSMFYLVH